jgi:hypothetical protein
MVVSHLVTAQFARRFRHNSVPGFHDRHESPCSACLVLQLGAFMHTGRMVVSTLPVPGATTGRRVDNMGRLSDAPK